MNEELTVQMTNLQIKQASLQSENVHLENEIGKLLLKLRIVCTSSKQVMELCRKLIEEGIYGLKTEKKLPTSAK